MSRVPLRTAPLLLALVCTACARPDEPRTPVVLIVLDALHGLHVQHLGYPLPTTPNLDALAADGVTFGKAFAPAPFTLASIPSLLTGRRPDTHGVNASTRRLSPAEITIAEHLRAFGYRTYGAVSNINGSSVYGDDQGFDEYVELFRSTGAAGDGAPWRGDNIHVPRADEFLPVLARWCDEAGSADGAPFFYLHLFEPHEPYAPPVEFRKRFLDPAYDGKFKDGVTVELTLQMIEREGRIVYDGASDYRAVTALYDANVLWVDSVLGRLLDTLKQRGLYDDALIIVTSDHGEAFWQHGRRGHGGYLYDEELQVPLVVKLPGADRPRGARVDRLASTLDVFPSLCAWLDLPLPRGGFEGVALAELLAAPAGESDERELVLRSYHPKYTAALRTATAKTIVRYDAVTGQVLGSQHYDLTRNPSETTTLSDMTSERARADVTRISEWIQRTRGAGSAVEASLTAEEREALRAVGYAGEDDDR